MPHHDWMVGEFNRILALRLWIKRFPTPFLNLARDLENVEKAIAAIAQAPDLPRRVPSYYDPSSPSYLYRSGNLRIHYRTPRPGVVEFLNLFWPKI